MKIALAGASGLVGTALIPALEAPGHEITRLVRTAPRAGEIEWHEFKSYLIFRRARQLHGYFLT